MWFLVNIEKAANQNMLWYQYVWHDKMQHVAYNCNSLG
jgi:hypothetical protein